MLLDAFHQYGLKTEQHANFRDAVLDALAEHFDDFGLWDFSWIKMYNHLTGSRVERLAAFYFALTNEPKMFESRCVSKGEKFRLVAEEQLENLPNGRTRREIWKEFMHCGRCAFHEHASGKCWRPADVGPWEDRGGK